ncbi:MAG: XRE family transcriptional regulator [Bacteroidota bacterium]
MNFNMLTLARELAGLTQVELVNRIPGLNQGNYSKMEKGLLNISDELLAKISYELNLPKSFFSRPTPNTDLNAVYYRKKQSISIKELGSFRAQTKVFSMNIDDLLTSIEIPAFELPKMKVTENLSADEIAHRIRVFMQLPSGPIENIIRRFESKGIIVHFINNAPEGFDGIAILTNNNQPVILVNNDLPNDRKRFTLAHELGHLVMHLRFSDITDDHKTIEKQANLFASEFLMPLDEIRNDLNRLTYGKLGLLKSFWKVSKASIIYKALQSEFIDDTKATNLRIELSRNGERKNEKIFIEIDTPILIQKIIDAHLNDLNYSKQEIIDYLSINNELFENLINRTATYKKLKLTLV